jgi:transcription initiation factor TFIIIB Brf1 subunit/transcription initiation factor TFIIB
MKMTNEESIVNYIVRENNSIKITNPFIKEITTRNLDISDTVFKRACLIHDEEVNNPGFGTKKGKSKLRYYLSCIKQASDELEEPYLLEDLAIQLGLDPKKDVNRMNKEYSNLQTGRRTDFNPISPIKELPKVCHKLGIEDVDEVIKYSKSIIEKWDWKNENTRLFTLSLIYSYMMSFMNYSIDKNTLARVSHYSENSIKNMAKKMLELKI